MGGGGLLAIHPGAYIGPFGDCWAIVFAHHHVIAVGVAIDHVIAYVVTRTHQCALVHIGAIGHHLVRTVGVAIEHVIAYVVARTHQRALVHIWAIGAELAEQ